MSFDRLSNTSLVLELGLNSTSSVLENNNTTNNPTKKPCLMSFEPSLLTLGFSGDHHLHHHGNGLLYRQESVSGGGSSIASVKREREDRSEESERVSNTNNNSKSLRVISDVELEDDEGCVNGRKKLRLTKAQSAMLEEAFKLHSTLNPQKQKQELARELKLRPRQVEVWFQNRRARTKLKQTEVDCEYLKKCCEKLTDENRKLQKELQELKALKATTSSQQLYMQLPAATLTMCPSCERIGDTSSSSKSAFTKPHFFNPFTNPSAAC